ncbi:Hypothetical protein GLP15_3154 [Giardia lamblia P15]|uniref:Uncharacterized protein n=1 Tax=Giardia intestinalis (strain P15) TaxID=658858 RepID=E1F7K1_GIAIA|nr:Hypothetical protein GLP15_3154 [Giardia lamblia P15]
MLWLSVFVAAALAYRPSDRKRDTYSAVLRSPKPCGLKDYEGLLTFIKSSERDLYDLTIEYGYTTPVLLFLDVNEQELGRVYIDKSHTPAAIQALLNEADIPVRR